MNASSSQPIALTADTTRRAAMALLIEAFGKAGIAEASYDARMLLCSAAEIDHAGLIRDPDVPLDDVACERLNAFAKRRLAREPVTRILGTRGFWSLDLVVAPGVLDPRQDSEALIDAALSIFGDRQGEALRIADLGSGSGALLCALMDIFPNATGLAIDVAKQACDLTRRNLLLCGMMARCQVLQGDWSGLDASGFDLIVCNPPYIPTDDIAGLDQEVRDFDPHFALDGGPDGLSAYRSLAKTLPTLLARGGAAIIELGIGQGPDVADLFKKAGFLSAGHQSDLNGVERALILKKADF